ncbi:MAG: amidase [Burkholderiales bacterium]|jgi:amidase
MNRPHSNNNDATGAFCPQGKITVSGAAHGPLARLRVGVKDTYDIAGYRTGAGNPDWLATHGPATRNAPVVDMLLAAGADIVGKTMTDELAYSLNGENHHYGTPVNPVTPDRIPGGSSCGSAVAVAAGLCDIGLGGDTAGSIRLPATFCGVWGFRPTHDAVSTAGVVPLAPSYDTVGWIAPDADILARAGNALLPSGRNASLPARLLLADDAWALANPEVREALNARLPAVTGHFRSIDNKILAEGGLLNWQQTFRVIQGREVWAAHGDWITMHSPRFGPGVRERFQWASTISADAAEAAAVERRRIAAVLDGVLEDAVLCIPTVSFVAPLKGSPTAEDDRTRALCLLSIAGLGRLPQVAIPAGRVNGCAIGLSLIGARGTDRALLACAAALGDLRSS